MLALIALPLLYKRTKKASRQQTLALARSCVCFLCLGKMTAVKTKTTK